MKNRNKQQQQNYSAAYPCQVFHQNGHILKTPFTQSCVFALSSLFIVLLGLPLDKHKDP